MSNIKVVDVNNEEGKEEVVEEPVETEQVKEEVVEHNNEVVNEEATEEIKEKAVEQPKTKAKAKPKASDKVECKTCDKTMTYKNYRYRHEKLCSDEPKPVKPHAKPKAKVKMMPKPKFQEVKVYEEQEEEEEVIPETKTKLSAPVSNQVLKPQPSNPLADITNHYQLLQQQFIQQKKEKYNNLCQNMFASRSRR